MTNLSNLKKRVRELKKDVVPDTPPIILAVLEDDGQVSIPDKDKPLLLKDEAAFRKYCDSLDDDAIVIYDNMAGVNYEEGKNDER